MKKESDAFFIVILVILAFIVGGLFTGYLWVELFNIGGMIHE